MQTNQDLATDHFNHGRQFNRGSNMRMTASQIRDNERAGHVDNELFVLAGLLRDRAAARAALTFGHGGLDTNNPDHLRDLARRHLRGENWRQEVREAFLRATEDDAIRRGAELLLNDYDVKILAQIDRVGQFARDIVDLKAAVEDYSHPLHSSRWMADAFRSRPGLLEELQAAARRAVGK